MNPPPEALQAAATKPTGGRTPEPCPQGQNSPVCSVRRQLPGRRTGLCRNVRPRVRERAAGVADCHANLLEHRVRGCRGANGSESGQTMCLKTRGRFDGGCTARNGVPESRDREASGFSQLKLSSSTTGNLCFVPILVGDRNLSTDRSRAIAGVDFVPQRSPTVRRVTHLGNSE